MKSQFNVVNYSFNERKKRTETAEYNTFIEY